MATPGLNQTFLTCNNDTSGVVTDPEGTSYTLTFRQPTLANNYLGLWVMWNANTGSPTLSVSDDQSQSWTNKHDVLNTAGPIHLTLFEMVNSVAGVRQITVSVGGTSSPTIAFCQFLGFEAYNIATSNPHDITPFDNGGSTTATTTPQPTGSVTPLTANDLIMAVCCDVNGDFASNQTTGFTAATNFTLRGTDIVEGFAMQWQADPNTSTITAANMAITSPVSGTFCYAGIALKSASAGTQATAEPYMRHTQWAACWKTGQTTFTHQFQTTADNVVVEWLGTQQTTTALAPMLTLGDGGTNTYTLTTGAGTNTGGTAQHGYSLGSTPGNYIMTITTAHDQLSTAVYTDMKFTKARFDKVVSDNTGNQTVAGDLTGTSLTPSQAGGAIFNCLSVNLGSMHDPVSPWNGTNPWHAAETSSGTDFLHEDNAWAWVSPTSVTGYAPTYHNSQPSGGVLNWSDESISFIGPPLAQEPISMPLFHTKGLVGPRSIAIHAAMRNKVPQIIVPTTVVDRRTERYLSRVGTRQAQ